MKTKFDDSVRERVFEARRQGKTLREISSATGVSMTTVKTWLSDAAKKNTAGIRIRTMLLGVEFPRLQFRLAFCGLVMFVAHGWPPPQKNFASISARPFAPVRKSDGDADNVLKYPDSRQRIL